MVVSEVTTKTHLAGHRFKLRVDKPVVVDGITVLSVGTTAWGEVLAASRSGNVGKGGSLEARLLYVENGALRILISGTNSARAPAPAARPRSASSRSARSAFFAKGNNAKIKAGELMTGFVEEDTPFPRPVSTGL